MGRVSTRCIVLYVLYCTVSTPIRRPSFCVTNTRKSSGQLIAFPPALFLFDERRMGIDSFNLEDRRASLLSVVRLPDGISNGVSGQNKKERQRMRPSAPATSSAPSPYVYFFTS